MSWTWKWFDILVVIGAVAIGFAVFFIPNFMNSKEMKDFVAVQKERKAALAAYEAQQAEVRREQEELGLVFVSPSSELPSVKAGEGRKKREVEELDRSVRSTPRESSGSPAESPKQQ